MGFRILVVDDNEDVLEVLGGLLRHAGHEPHLARDGRAVYAYLASGARPHLVFLDYMLPDLHPTTIAAKLRERFADVPIVIVSGVDEADIPQANAFIRKPFPFERIDQIVDGILRRGIGTPFAP
jgi:two-component system, OmpR family, response regulator